MNLRTCNFFGKFFEQFSLCSWNWGWRPVSLLIITICLHCVCLTTVTHTHIRRPRQCPCNVCVFVREQLRGHTSFFTDRDPQTPKCLQSWCVCVCARCTNHYFLGVYGRFFPWILSQHSSWSTFLQSLGVQLVISACLTSVLLLLPVSHCSFLNLNSKWQGGKDLSGNVVCSSDLRASVCLSGGRSSLPVVFPVRFRCVPVSCKHFRNFQSPQLKRAEFRGFLFCVCGH